MKKLDHFIRNTVVEKKGKRQGKKDEIPSKSAEIEEIGR